MVSVSAECILLAANEQEDDDAADILNDTFVSEKTANVGSLARCG